MDGGVVISRGLPPGHSTAISGCFVAFHRLMERHKWSILLSVVLLLACLGDHAVTGNCASQDRGTLTAWTGSVKSANFGISYSNKQLCSWRIRLARGNRVRINMLSFELEEREGDRDCYDALKVFDGGNDTATPIGEYCGTDFPEEITSTGRSLFLVFETDNTNVFLGFSLTYTGICSGYTINVTVAEVGWLESPRFTPPYPASITCSWVLETQAGYRIDVEFMTLALSLTDNCGTSVIQVFDGISSADTKLGEFCGSEIEPGLPSHVVSSTDNVLHLYFQGAAEPFQGFKLEYSTELLACSLSPCQNEGSCSNVDLDFSCVCAPGWSGKACDVNIDDCAAWPCGEYGADCEDRVNGFVCSCMAGYEGALCNVDTNECASNPCENGATCVDAINEYSCGCTDGFMGIHCSEVNACGLAPCQHGGTCRNDADTYICTCVDGYEGQQCEIDIQECASSPCGEHGACLDLINAYECDCEPGFVGINCETDIQECASSPCGEHGACLDLINAYECDCEPRFVGINCETEIQECASSPCGEHGACLDLINAYECNCEPGFVGINCETDIQECASSPCCEHGACLDLINAYECNCEPGFEGINCETDIDECSSAPCLNDAICVDDVNGYSCNCPDGYRGNHCEEDINECASGPCRHGSTCWDEANGFHCQCLPGYDGVYCQNNINECSSDPCHNDGLCVEVNEFQCSCKEGFVGVHCETDVNECSSNPCINGGTCVDQTNRFLCQCPEGFIGDTCEAKSISKICKGGADGIEGSGLVWDDTDPGHSNVKPCPEGTAGNASRWCDWTAQWNNLDLSQCVSPAFAEISGKAELLKSGNASASDVLDLANALQNVTQIAGPQGEGGDKIYPGDMDVAINSLSIISEVIGSVEDLDADTAKDLTKVLKNSACVGTVNNIVDESQLQTWKIHGNLEKIAPSVSTLIGTTETLANTVGIQQTKQLGSGDNPNDGEDTVLVIKEKNLEMEIAVFLSNETDQQEAFMASYKVGEDGVRLSSILLPNNLLKAAEGGNTTSPAYVGIMTGKFTSVGELFNLANDYGENQTRKGYVNADVLSLKVLGLPEDNFQKLKSPVVLVFKHKEAVDADNTSCVFLNMSARSSDDRWNDIGCELKSSNETHTVCVCSHLTNFAILMDVHGTQSKLAEGHQTALSVLSYIGGTLSILGCFFSIAIYKFFRLKSDRIRVHMHLAAAIATAQLIFLVGIERNEIAWVCKMIAVVLHYSLTAMFCWMLVEGIQLYLALVHIFGSSSHIKKYLLLGWGAPVFIVGISFGVFFKDYAAGNVCWMSQKMLLIVFVPTVAILIILNTAVLIIVLKVMMTSLTARAKSKDSDTSQIKSGLKAALVLLPLLGLTWVFGFLSVSEHTIVFTYMFAICNSLQGLFFFIAHCLMNIEVKRAYQRRYGRKKQMHSMMTSSIAPLCSCSQNSASHGHRQNDASTTELIKSNLAVNTVSGGHDNPAMKDTCLGKDPDKPKGTAMNNATNLISPDQKKMACSDGVKVNDIQCLIKNSESGNDDEKGLVNGAKVVMETIVSKETNLKMDGSNLA